MLAELKMSNEETRQGLRKPRSQKELDFQKEVGAKLRYLREAKGLTVDDFVEALREAYPGEIGFNYSSINGCERGERTLQPYRLCLIAQWCNVPTTYFFSSDIMRREIALIPSFLNLPKNRKTKLSASVITPVSCKAIPAKSSLAIDKMLVRPKSPIQSGYYILSERKCDADTFVFEQGDALIHLQRSAVGSYTLTDSDGQESNIVAHQALLMLTSQTCFVVLSYTCHL